LLAAAMTIVSCSRRNPEPPDAEFLVATADSAFWVSSGEHGIRVKAVPMTLALFNGRFHEVFVAQLDRSFDDAIFTGERVYVRDLQSNDSSIVYDDTAIVAIAAQHARMYPDAIPLNPDDATPDDPMIAASGETDILEVRGPYALLEHRVEYEMQGGGQHDTVRTAVDLRTGAAATSATMRRDAASVDSNLVRTVPRRWTRKGYTVSVRSASDGSVLIALGDRSRNIWPLFTVGSAPRVYWLDHPAMSATARRALMRAFNSAASYDEAVKFVKFIWPPAADRHTHPAAHA
jgi:hypothetical protein